MPLQTYLRFIELALFDGNDDRTIEEEFPGGARMRCRLL